MCLVSLPRGVFFKVSFIDISFIVLTSQTLTVESYEQDAIISLLLGQSCRSNTVSACPGSV